MWLQVGSGTAHGSCCRHPERREGQLLTILPRAIFLMPSMLFQVPPWRTATATRSSKLPPGAHGVSRGCRTRGTSLGILRALPPRFPPQSAPLAIQHCPLTAPLLPNLHIYRQRRPKSLGFYVLKTRFTLGQHAARMRPLHPSIRLLPGPKAGYMRINKIYRMISLLLCPQHQWE